MQVIQTLALHSRDLPCPPGRLFLTEDLPGPQGGRASRCAGVSRFPRPVCSYVILKYGEESLFLRFVMRRPQKAEESGDSNTPPPAPQLPGFPVKTLATFASPPLLLSLPPCLPPCLSICLSISPCLSLSLSLSLHFCVSISLSLPPCLLSLYSLFLSVPHLSVSVSLNFPCRTISE